MSDEKPFNDKEDQQSARDMAKHFGVEVPFEKPLPILANMTKEEIEKLEEEEKNSSDIYRIAARVKNLARSGGASLTGVGESMCNLYVHVLKAVYDFADTLEEPKKEELRALLRKHEDMPGRLIGLSRKK